MNVVWSPEALEDIERAIDYLVERSPASAERVATGIVAVVEQLATEPLDGPEHLLPNGELARSWPFLPFRIYYQRRPDAFLVLRVYHQRREPITR